MWQKSIRARTYISAAGILLVIIAVLFGIFSQNKIESNSNFNINIQLPSEKERAMQWPNFRGPEGNGHAALKNAALKWDGESGENIAWKTTVPKPGYSSPVTWQDKIFITGGDKISREVYCFSVKDGRLIWQRQVNDLPSLDSKLPAISDG